MKTYQLSMLIHVEDGAVEKLKKLTHHIEWLLDLDSWPEIFSVSDVEIKEYLMEGEPNDN